MSLSDILQIERQRIERERVVLTTIYERMKNRINMSVRAKSKECVYKIPEFMPGYPLVDIPKTMIYLLKKLTREGFIALPMSNLEVYITWDPNELVKLSKITRKTSNIQESDKVTRKTTEKISERINDDFLQSLINSKNSDPFA